VAAVRLADPCGPANLSASSPLGVWRSSATVTGFVELAGSAASSTRSRGPTGAPARRGRFRGEDDLPGTFDQVTTDHPVILPAHEPDIVVRVPPRVSPRLADADVRELERPLRYWAGLHS
jgi:hypothetical protein